MIGLLIKDLYVLKKQLKLLLIFLLFYAFLSYSGDNSSMFIYMAVMFGFFLPITSISYDDRCEWNKLALTMPIRSTSIVLSKYLLGILGIGFGILCFLLLTVFMNSSLSADTLQTALVSISIGAAVLSIYLPICFKYGVEKSRFIIIAIFMIPTFLVGFLMNGNYIKVPTKEQITHLINLVPFLAVGLLIISILISSSIMKRKEY